MNVVARMRSCGAAGADCAGAVAAAVTTAAKWALVGTIRAGEHPLWSSFVWRTEVSDTFTEMVAAPWFARAAAGTHHLAEQLDDERRRVADVRDRPARQSAVRQHSRKTTAHSERFCIGRNLLRHFPTERGHACAQVSDLLGTGRLSRHFTRFPQVLHCRCSRSNRCSTHAK